MSPRAALEEPPPPASSPLPLCALAPAKINLGLFVGPLRADGRHELVSVMQSISLADRLELDLAPSPQDTDEVICPGVEGENLAARALEALRERPDWRGPALRLRIEKRIPVAAGLAGGSADAAAALRLAARGAGRLEPRALLEVARGLGADVPAQIHPGRSLAGGAGEDLEWLPDPLAPFGVLILPLEAGLSTAAVYRRADELRGCAARRGPELAELREALREALADGAQLPGPALLINDLQEAAISLCPEISHELARARRLGADHVLVSGSGPTVLGLFVGPRGPARAREVAAALSARHPAATWAVPVRGPTPQALRGRGALRAIPVTEAARGAQDAPLRNNQAG